VMILADLGQAAGSVLLIASFVSGAFQLWHLYAIAFLQGTFAIFQGPAEVATITLLVPERHRERANAAQEISYNLASVLAPALTGLIYVIVGVTGVLALDLATFAVAAFVLVILPIPRPPASVEGQVGRGDLLDELRTGLRFFRLRKPLFALVLYMAFSSFMLNGPLDLTIPYFLSLTGSSTQMGAGMAIMALGAFAGALLISVIGGYRPRMRLLVAGALLNGAMFLVYGIARTLPVLAASLFVLMVPLPINGVLYRSILQVKTPPDLQGRAFALGEQLALLGSTASFLITGQLVDRLLEPAVGASAWRTFAPLVGDSRGAGIGLLQVATGVILLVVTGIVFSIPRVRNIEADLPDYEATDRNG